MEERFYVSFASSENEFIYNYGVNNGHTLTFHKVTRCYFLSSHAKQLYTNISNYAYGDKRKCHPSQRTLMAELGWCKNTLLKYLKELKDFGFISVDRRGAKGMLEYRIEELHKIPALVHSEILHELREEFDSDKFYDLLDEYKKSELCKRVLESDNPIVFKNEIYSWFTEKRGQVNEVSIELPNAFSTAGLARQVSIDSKGDKRKLRRSYKDVPVQEWNTHHFLGFFEACYREKHGLGYPFSEGDHGAMKRVIDQNEGDNEVVKACIEVFIQSDYFDVKTVKAFSSSFVQSVLKTYLSTGKFPDYKKGKRKKDKVPEEWVSNLDGIWGEE